MFFLSYKARPAADSPEAETIGKAQAYCWVNCDSQTEAEKIAAAAIFKQHWRIIRLEIVEAVDLAELGYSPEALERIAQAQADGVVCEFHKYAGPWRLKFKIPWLIVGTVFGSLVGIGATAAILTDPQTRPFAPLGFIGSILLGVAIGFAIDLFAQRRRG